MKAVVRHINDHGVHYNALMFVCPGCVSDGHAGIHMLPVNAERQPSWDWDGNLDAPTLSPSILSRPGSTVCHSFLRNGVFEFLGDCTHSLAGQSVPLPELPRWAEEDE